jgi:hypothetical protein
LFPIFDATFFKTKCDQSNITVSKTALVIDDIIDLYWDLTRPDSLFGETAFSDFMSDYPGLMTQVSARPHVDWINYCAGYLLIWRAQEVTLVQSIVKQLDCKFLLWGIKQDPKVLIDWLKNPKNEIFYLSHPISEPRRDLKSTAKWPDIVRVINDLQLILEKHDM